MKIKTQSCSLWLLALVMCGITGFAQTQEDRIRIRNTYDLQKLNQLKNAFDQRETSQKQRALDLAAINGWSVQLVNEDGSFDELMEVSPEGEPVYYSIHNVNAARSTRTNHLNIGGSLGTNLDGQNMNCHIWDGGPTRVTHQEFDGAGGSNRVTINDGVTTLNSNSFHAQHVTGTMVASGVQASAKGMAPQAKALTHDWNSDLTEATTEASNGMLLSNHSYGFRANLIPDWYFGAYIGESRDWDNLMYNAPYYLMVVAAGNDGNDNSSNGNPLNGNSSYDKLSGHSTSKNNLVVANAQDANVNNDGTLNSVVINSGSSEGPTDDLRIKPDITGNGTAVYSTFDNADNAYNTITGTSMASPNVSGSLLLLQQQYNGVTGSFMRAATLKGLALHTADDAGGSGPDAIYGWGLLNTKRASEAISGNGTQSKIEELILNSGQTYTTTVTSDGVNMLMASISWTDPAGTANTGTPNLTNAVLVNDLDIRISKGGNSWSPYRLTGITTNGTGDNVVDPYERIDVAGANGTYTISVTHKGSLTGGSQRFSLIVTGISQAVACNAVVPTGLQSANITSSGATLNWTAISGASYDIRYRVIGSSIWTNTTSSTSSISLSGLIASTDYEAQVRSRCPDNSESVYTASANFTTSAFQPNYCASNGNSVVDEYISRVQLASIDNSSGAGSGGYTDFTSISTDLNKGTNYTITVTPTWTGTVYNEGYAVWIDLNRDGDFADAGEQLWTQATTNASSVSGSFSIPSGAMETSTRMRVSMKYNGVPTSCETFSYGEVEDYTVNIKAAVADNQPPTVPTSLAASNVAQTSLNLSWNASNDNVGVVAYDVYQDNINIGSTSATSLAVTGLSPSTAYSFFVRARDAAGNISPSSNVVNITTPAAANYCNSQGNSIVDEYIGRVKFGTIDNSSTASSGYTDFTSISTNLNAGSSYAITITPVWTSTVYQEAYSVWIDFNRDGDFTDAGEQVYTRSATTASPVSGNISISGSATPGATRMRVSMKYNGIPTSCETFSYGEVEDYTVNIVNAGPNSVFTINSLEEEPFVNVYPNPVVGSNLHVQSNISGLNYQIRDMAGRLLVMDNVRNENIEVGNLASGWYLIEFKLGSFRREVKFQKL